MVSKSLLGTKTKAFNLFKYAMNIKNKQTPEPSEIVLTLFGCLETLSSSSVHFHSYFSVVLQFVDMDGFFFVKYI